MQWLKAGSAQQHTATRHAFCPEPCCRALVFCDCTPVCRMAVSAVAQGFCQLVLHSSTGQQGMHSSTGQQGRQVTLYTAAMYWCYKAAVNWFCTATRHAFCREPCCRALVFCDCTPVCRMAVSAVAQGFCQLVLHSSTGQQGRQVTLYTAAMYWCYKAAVNWFCTATRHAFCREPCCRALVFCDCTPVCRMAVSAVAQGFCQLVLHSSTDYTPVCRVDLHRSKCSGLRLLSAGPAQQHRATGHASYLVHCSNVLVLQGCCQLVLHSNKACFLP